MIDLASLTVRRVHRWLAILSCIVLVWQGVTGALYALLHYYSLVGPAAAAVVMSLHTGSILGRWFGTLHPIVSGTIALVQIGLGLSLNGLRPPPSVKNTEGQIKLRRLHRAVATWAAPLLIIVFGSGVLYRFSRRILNADKAAVGFLMEWHTLAALHLESVFPLIGGLLSIVVGLGGLILSFGVHFEQRMDIFLAGKNY